MTNPAGGSGEPAEARRAVLNFEVSTGGIPAGATIDSVFLTMAASKAPTVAPMTITLHRVLADWGEGASVALGEEGGGASSAGGDATWIHTFFDTTMWTNPGGDYVPVASASQTVTVSGNGTTFTYYTWGSTPQMVADVQMWQDTPSSDFGWILIGEEAPSQTNARRFGSRTGPTFQVPDLCIYYH
jgi:hypothetical protein